MTQTIDSWMTTYSPAYAAPALPPDAAAQPTAGYRPRSLFTPVPFIVPVILSLVAVLGGGIGALMDFSFILLTLLCAVYFVNELIHFPRRFGVGGIVLFGGVLIWFSYDYFQHWYQMDWGGGQTDISARAAATAVLMHCLFVLCMTIGLKLPFGRWLEKTFFWVPDPASSVFFLWLAIILFVLGVAPYFIWAKDEWYLAIWDDFTGMRVGGARWNLQGAGGNINLTGSWGPYVLLLWKGGQFGGTMAVFYAVLLSRSLLGSLIGWLIWLFWLAMAFGSGTRGQVFFMAGPATACLFLKYQAQAAAAMRRLSKRAYLWSFLIGCFMLVLIQWQGALRGSQLDELGISKLSGIDVTNIQGNSMFSEGLMAFELIPKEEPFFYASRPGETFLRPLPQAAFDFVTQIIPRPLWPGKPRDEASFWYNSMVADTGVRGTSIAPGIVTWWYMRFSWPGVLQGGLLFGWLLVVCERVIQKAGGRTMPIVLGLAVAAWLFRSYRIWFYHELYPVIFAAAAIFILVKLADMLNARRAG